jgi:DNA uptake protein ComE-like DNA-binding protein
MSVFSKNWLRGAMVPLVALVGVAPISAEDFPEGAGKTLIMRSCGQCHSTDQIARQKKSEPEWQATVVRMAGRGAKVTGEETDTIVKYLAANFMKVEDASKVNINKAAAKDFLVLGFTAEEANLIIDYRTRHGDFRDWADLLQIYGVNGEKAEAAKDKMSF